MGLQVQEFKEIEFTLSARNAYAAWARIGASSAHFVRRILYWINQNATTMSPDDWINLRAEIGVLGSIFFSGPEPWDHFLKHNYSPDILDNIFYPMVSQEGTERFLSIMTTCLEDISRHVTAEVGPLMVTFFIHRKNDSKEKVKRPKTDKIGPNPRGTVDQAIYRVVEALERCGGLVNRCPECSLLFLAERINQQYCSSNCLSRVTTRRSRDKKKKNELPDQKRKEGKATKSTKEKVGGRYGTKGRKGSWNSGMPSQEWEVVCENVA